MIVTFFKGKHETCMDGLNYLKGGTKKRKVAPELLKGNPELTEQHLQRASKFAKAYTTGCLSFEEENIPHAQKLEFMQQFEDVLMAGIPRDRYDVVWYEHRDKDRLELNFHFVNMDLKTGSSLTPYVHKRDIVRVDTWKNIINDEYGFANPNDPERERTTQLGNSFKKRAEVINYIDDNLTALISEGLLNSQDDVVSELKLMGLEVPKVTKKSISVKHEGFEKPIRLKGAYYEQSFGGIEKLSAEYQQKVREFKGGRERRIEENKRKLQESIGIISGRREEKYREPEPEEQLEDVNNNSVDLIDNNDISDIDDLKLETINKEQQEVKDEQLHSTISHERSDNKFCEKVKEYLNNGIEQIRQAFGRLGARIDKYESGARELTQSYKEPRKALDGIEPQLQQANEASRKVLQLFEQRPESRLEARLKGNYKEAQELARQRAASVQEVKRVVSEPGRKIDPLKPK